MHRDQAGDAAALEVLAANEMARALRRDQRDVDLRRRLDLAVVDREAVAEQQRVAGSDPVADRLLPDVVVALVGEQDHHDVPARGGVGDVGDLEALGAGLIDGRGVRTEPDDDIDAGVLEVERVGVPLGAVAEDGHGLALEEV